MKVELLRAVSWEGVHRDAGEVLDLSDFDAHTLISYGKAKPYAEPEKPIVNRSVELETSTAPKTTKRSYRKKII